MWSTWETNWTILGRGGGAVPASSKEFGPWVWGSTWSCVPIAQGSPGSYAPWSSCLHPLNGVLLGVTEEGEQVGSQDAMNLGPKKSYTCSRIPPPGPSSVIPLGSGIWGVKDRQPICVQQEEAPDGYKRMDQCWMKPLEDRHSPWEKWKHVWRVLVLIIKCLTLYYLKSGER